ncbi:hypothetical protein BN871_HV_00060 [Paenibacillus sp. P22]|nr:hypothetical protein BN871_HV_00060 [Paenibacillus sp. P22]
MDKYDHYLTVKLTWPLQRKLLHPSYLSLTLGYYTGPPEHKQQPSCTIVHEGCKVSNPKLDFIRTAAGSVSADVGAACIGVRNALARGRSFTGIARLDADLDTADRVDRRLAGRLFAACVAAAGTVAVLGAGLDQVADLLQVERLETKQRLSDQMHFLALLGKQLLRAVVALVDEVLHLLVDLVSNLVGVVLLMADIPSKEYLALRAAELHRTELVAHAVFHDHAADDSGRLLEVAVGTGSDFSDEQLLGYAAAQQAGDLVEHLLLGDEHAVFLGKHDDITAGASARNDRDLVNHVGILQEVADNGVARLVVSDDALLAVADDAAFLLGAHDDAVDRFIDLGHADILLVASCGKQRRFIKKVLEIGAGKARRPLRDDVQLDVLVERLVARVDFEDGLASFYIRAVDRDLTVEAAWTKQRGIQNVRTVGGGYDDDAFVGAEAVHLDEQLVERLLALVMSAPEACAPLASDSVDLVDEDDARRVLLGVLEQVADAGCAYADEHLDEVRAGDAEERNSGFACDSAGQERLAGTRRAHQQHALRNAGADCGELARILEEFDDLDELLLLLVGAGDILERDPLLLFVIQTGFALAKVHDLAAAALCLIDQEEEQDEDDHERNDGGQECKPDALAFHFLVLDLDSVLQGCIRNLLGGVFLRVCVGEELERIAFRPRWRFLVFTGHQIRVTVELNRQLVDVVSLELLLELVVTNLGAVFVLIADELDNSDGYQENKQVKSSVPDDSIHPLPPLKTLQIFYHSLSDHLNRTPVQGRQGKSQSGYLV